MVGKKEEQTIWWKKGGIDDWVELTDSEKKEGLDG